MGLFDKLFGGGDPSAKWVRDSALKVEVDLGTGSLCGVRLGLRPDALSRLGPPESKSATEEGTFAWLDLGVQADAQKGLLTSYTIGFRLEGEGFSPFGGSILLDGKPIGLGGASRPEDVLGLLGEPWHRYADPEDPEGDVSWFYERRGLEWEVEMLASGLLSAIVLHAPPSLADPEARQLLRVEKPWPPQG